MIDPADYSVAYWEDFKQAGLEASIMGTPREPAYLNYLQEKAATGLGRVIIPGAVHFRQDQGNLIRHCWTVAILTKPGETSNLVAQLAAARKSGFEGAIALLDEEAKQAREHGNRGRAEDIAYGADILKRSRNV